MQADQRNTYVVIGLIVAMTAGAALLRWLEPRQPRLASDMLLMAEPGSRIEHVTIEYAPPGTTLNEDEIDCAVLPEPPTYWWKPHSADIRLVVVGSDDEKMSDPQKKTLLAVLLSMTQDHGLDLSQVELDPASDPEITPDLPVQTRDLRALLANKAILRPASN